MVTVGSLVFSIIAALTIAAGVFHLVPLGRRSSFHWRWWAFGISVDGAVFAMGVAVQQSASPGLANLIADRVSFITIPILVILLVGFTYSYWNAPYRWILAILGPINLAMVGFGIFSDLVVVPEFTQRASLPFFGGSYWEAVSGPLQFAFSVYSFVVCLACLVGWLVLRERVHRGSGLFLIGYVGWLALGLLDVVSNSTRLPLPPTLAFGFLVFAVFLLFMSSEEARILQLRAERSERRYRTLVENTQDLVLLLDPKLRILYANPAVTVRTGHTLDDVLGRSPLELVHPDDRPIVQSIIERVLATKAPGGSFEHRAVDESGGTVWLEAQYSVQ